LGSGKTVARQRRSGAAASGCDEGQAPTDEVPRAVVQVQTGPAGELVEIHVLAALTTSGAQEPRPPLHIQINWNPVPIDQNINRQCGEPI
jgi:hypothetical protein